LQNNTFIISVVIPTYNRANLLIKAIKSVLNQTFPVLEILVCDDGSSDNSKELVSGINSNIIKWIDCGKNGRPAIPRNIGIKQAKGNWIAFLDSDDEWLCNKIEEQINVIRNSSYKVISTNAWSICDTNKKLFFENCQSKEITFDELVKSNRLICSSVLCEKELLLNTLLFPEQQGLKALEDYVLWLKLASFSPIYFLEIPLLNYLDAPNQSIRNDSDDTYKQRELIFNYFKNLKNYISKKQMVIMYTEFIWQYKNRLQRLFDIYKLRLWI
jgi:glycosyltransferase involved in cell wall biosynthesis